MANPCFQSSPHRSTLVHSAARATRGLVTLILIGLASFALAAPSLTGVSITPSSVFGGSSATGTVTLSDKAPTAGTTITLSSSNSNAVTPKSVLVAAGETSATFTVTTKAVGVKTTATIKATLSTVSKTANLEMDALAVQSVVLSPTSVTTGGTSSGTVTLNAPAPEAGKVVTLSSNQADAVVPEKVTIPAGESTGSFTVTTKGATTQLRATIKAVLGSSSATTILQISPSVSYSVALSPTSVVSGVASTGTITLSKQAPTGGLSFTFSSSSSAVMAPASATIAAGATSTTFSLTTTGVTASTTANVSVQLGSQSESATLTVTPASLISITLNPTVVGGGSHTVGTATLSGPAPSEGFVVALSSSSTIASVPASVTIAAGAQSANFTVTTIPVTSAKDAVITATAAGVSKTASLGIKPLGLADVIISPSSVAGGGNSTGTVELNAPAPAGGIVVDLSSPSAVVTVPNSVTIAAGSTTVDFQLTTKAVSVPTLVTITATYGKGTKTATLDLTLAGLSVFEISPTTVTGGSTSTGTVTLSGPAPAGGLVVNLGTNALTAVPPASVTIPAGQTSITFTINTTKVTKKTVVELTAQFGPSTKTVSLTVNK